MKAPDFGCTAFCMKETLAENVYDAFRSCEWFQKLESKLTTL